ncbi:MAG: hypothetical protein K2H89_03650 [Oscillospiraceae bacterium]|nr:hypothetical protein [Oscillospiraceae bacterium]
MKEILAMNVDNELANIVQIIQILKDCGIINVTTELSCMDNLWEKLAEEDKRFITGMIKGAVATLANKKDCA